MARPIDAEKYMELLKEQYLHYKAMKHGEAASAWQGAMQLLYDMPTLTPPNEPLSIEQLFELDGEPVWLEPLRWWALIEAPRGVRRAIFRLSNGGWRAYFSDDDLRNDRIIVYRRPPEGEEKHNG